MHAHSTLRRRPPGYRCTREARGASPRGAPAGSFASENTLADEALEIVAVAGLAERACQTSKLMLIDEALAVRDLFGAPDLKTLPCLDRLDEVCGSEERAMGAGVEPCDAPPEDLDAQ